MRRHLDPTFIVMRLRTILVPALVLAVLMTTAMLGLQQIVRPGPGRLPGNDAVNLYFWELFTRKTLAQGELPHWNPYHMAGAPHMADTQTTVWYPPAMMLRVLPPMAFLPWMAALHVWLAGTGGVLLARVVGCSWLAALAAGMAMMLGGSVGPWLYNGHLLVLYCAAWLPWALALSIVSARRDTRLPHPALVAVMVLQFLAGYLQGSLYITAVVAGYFLYRALLRGGTSTARSRVRPLQQLLVLGIVSLGLSAFQLLPLLQLTAEAGRTAGLPYADARDGGLHLADMARLFFPFRGVPADPPYRFLPDALIYVGWCLAALVPFAFLDRQRRQTAVFLAAITVAVIALACAADLPFYRLHYLLFPGLRIPGRLLFVATAALAVLGAIGLDAFVRSSVAREWRRMLPAAVASVLLIGAAAAATLPQAQASGTAPSHQWPFVPALGIGAVLAVAAVASRGYARAATAIAVACAAFDLVTFVAPATHSVPIESADTMREVMGPPDGGRGLSVCEHRIGPGEFLMNGQATVDGLAGLHLADYADYAALARSGAAPPHDGLFRRIGSDGVLPARADLVSLANVSVVYSCAPLDAPGLTFVSHADPIYRYRNDAAWPRAIWTCDLQEATAADAVAWLLSGRYDDRRRLVRRPTINVRWSPGTSDQLRHEVERRRHLVEGARREGTTWRYALADWSEENGLALLREPAVEDTAGIDRQTGVVVAPLQEGLRSTAGGGYWVLGTRDCDDSATLQVRAREADGVVDVDVDGRTAGFVFLSDAYYPERRAFVDGKPVDALRAQIAFTAVPVGAGRHHVQVRYVPRTFRIGLGVSVATLLAWVVVPRVLRRRASISVETHAHRN